MDLVTAIMAATRQVITVATPQRTATTATLPHTTADTGRATMLRATMVGTGASFAEHTPTAPGIIAGIVTAGDRHRQS
jgi:hypothetical protein